MSTDKMKAKIESMQQELTKLGSELEKDAEGLLDTFIPVDPVPFNEVSQFFSLAATAMCMFQSRDTWLTTRTELLGMLCTVGADRDKAERIVEMVFDYYRKHPSSQSWMWAVKVRDKMLEATDTKVAPWWILRSDDKKRARLNAIRHILKLIPYEKMPRKKIKLPARSKAGAYDDQASLKRYRFVPEKY